MASDEKGVRYREFPEQRTRLDHYPLALFDVVMRWRGVTDHPDDRGYIVEANIGVLVEGAGHYGDNLLAAREAAHRIVRYLRAARQATGEGRE